MQLKFYSPFFILLLSAVITSCAVNPVTGRNEISLVSEAQERAIGEQQYGPSQQSQGGEFTVDQTLSDYVNTVGQRIAAVSDRPLDYEFVVLNNSVPNAWALPGGKIAVNRGLLTELKSEAELAAVLGHEVVHAAAGHGAQAMTRGTLLQGVLAVGAIALQDNDYGDYIVGASQLGAQLITTRYGREAERESDYYGIQYMVAAGYDPRAAVSLQETFVRLSEGNNPGWLDGLF
ncbi:MAG: M48 family metalloprotease, partial [Gammaproteobacteria bacterium]|nr:M48 family metalloprotease [Gammaproteobacteria bacterium]